MKVIKRQHYLALLVVALNVLPNVYAASNDTVYVRDTLYVPLRGGQSIEHRILHQGLKSGTKLIRLEVNADSGYTKVETENGTIGWIPSQYLVEQPSASLRLVDANLALDKLKTNNERMREQLTQQSNEQIETKDQIKDLSDKNAALQTSLNEITTLAADVIAIDARNEELSLEQSTLNDQIKILIESNEEIRDHSAQSWFIRGAGTVIVSLILGFFISRKLYLQSGGGWR